MPNIAIVWDFDGTLTPIDSTTFVVEAIQGKRTGGDFWKYIHSLKGDKSSKEDWEHVLAMDAPIWMYSLSRIAFEKGIPLNTDFFQQLLRDSPINLYRGVEIFLNTIKEMQNAKAFKNADLKIHHFIVSAGLKELIEQVLPQNLITWTFGCRYKAIISNVGEKPENVPVFCVDETAKTRSLFEISKGVFETKDRHVNKKTNKDELWVPFDNIIYVGDGDTDIPALSLTRSKGGMGIVLLNPQKTAEENKAKMKKMNLNLRADLITFADYALDGELFKFIQERCHQILQRYEAESLEKVTS